MSDGGESTDTVANDNQGLGPLTAAAHGPGIPGQIVDSTMSDTDQLEDDSSSAVQGDNAGDGASIPAMNPASLSPTFLAIFLSEGGSSQMQLADEMSDEDLYEPATPLVPPVPAVPAQRRIAVIDIFRDGLLSTPRFRRRIIVVPQAAD